MTNTKTRLDAIRARLDAARAALGTRPYEYTYVSHENADLICHAVLDLEYLLDRVSPVSEETIRRAAIRIHADRCCPCDTTGCDYPQDLPEEIKLARLALGVCDDQ